MRCGTAWRRCIAAAVASVVLLAACGGDDDDAAGEASEESEIDPEGVLRIGYSLTASGGLTFDLTKITSSYQDPLVPLYDTLLRNLPDGTQGPGLAKRAEVVDPQTVEIELQPGVTFSDGSPFDAEAVKASILRNATSGGQAFRPELRQTGEIDVQSPTVLTVHLKAPVAGSYVNLLATGDFMLASTKAIAGGRDPGTDPVGAGPFVLTSFQPGTKVVLKKNPRYFQADDIKLAGIEYIHIDSDVAGQNALKSGAIDVLPAITPAGKEALTGIDGITLSTDDMGNSWYQMFLCKSRPPFDNLKVRQALNYAIDKETFGEVLFGEANPVYGFWPKGSKFYDPSLEGAYDYDPQRAEELLAEAGYDASKPLEFTAYYLNDPQAIEIIQQMFAEVGVKMNVQLTTNIFGEFLQEARNPAALITMGQAGTGKVTRLYGPGVPTNVCKYENPELNATMLQLAALDQVTPDPGAVKLWQKAQQIVSDEALGLFGVFIAGTNAWTDRVDGIEIIPGYTAGHPVPSLFGAYVKA